ncbi:hypothetical protein DFR70_1264 [Nocardia tenerifensis]|uniref:Uncharacterized protein n=1 Tax=Nocardia tenerifensis TaxID=228006 RepID=A0A318JT26_9NOCA|nr:hypothetical protein [Nocardia tenerifensis]PXX53883.1 hypothetical protein DFR70_1264 [Nocardia tenerifensis]
MAYVRLVDPDFWWLVRREQVPRLEDPDLVDGRVRWPDRDRVNWQAVAAAVDTIAGLLDEPGPQGWPVDEVGAALIPCDLAELGETESGIVRSWFITPPVFDPWDIDLNDGRHRLWGVWSVAPAARVPVRSEILGYARAVEISRSDDYCERLSGVPWFDSSRGANRRYALTVARAMQGLLPGGEADSDPPIERPLGTPVGPDPAVLETAPGQKLAVPGSFSQRARLYPVELWQLSDGRRIAIVSETYTASSPANASESIMAAVGRQWPGAVVLEHWLPDPSGLVRGAEGRHGSYCWSTGNGGYRQPDLSDLLRHGLDLR